MRLPHGPIRRTKPLRDTQEFGAFSERPYTELDLTDSDVDGDALLDGEDDQDFDDYTNIREVYEAVLDLDSSGGARLRGRHTIRRSRRRGRHGRERVQPLCAEPLVAHLRRLQALLSPPPTPAPAPSQVGCGRHVSALHDRRGVPRPGPDRHRRGPPAGLELRPEDLDAGPRQAPARPRPRRPDEDREGPRRGHLRHPPRAHARQPGGAADREPRLRQLGGADEPVAGGRGGRRGPPPRPGHADLAGVQKYGLTDVRNVLERASARETAARVAAGRARQGLPRRARRDAC